MASFGAADFGDAVTPQLSLTATKTRVHQRFPHYNVSRPAVTTDGQLKTRPGPIEKSLTKCYIVRRCRLLQRVQAVPWDFFVIFLPSLDAALTQCERELLEQALSATSGNISRTAQMIGTDRAGVYRRMRRLGIDVRFFRR
jgi:transcriptional regulator with GAF, ATPase, and Fis domain